MIQLAHSVDGLNPCGQTLQSAPRQALAHLHWQPVASVPVTDTAWPEQLFWDEQRRLQLGYWPSKDALHAPQSLNGSYCGGHSTQTRPNQLLRQVQLQPDRLVPSTLMACPAQSLLTLQLVTRVQTV